MNEEEVIRNYSNMWGEGALNYVLVKDERSILGYIIMDVVYNNMVLVEDDAIAKYIIEKMLDNGVRVVDDFEQVRNPNRPDPLFYSPEDEAQFRKWQEQQRNKKGTDKK